MSDHSKAIALGNRIKTHIEHWDQTSRAENSWGMCQLYTKIFLASVAQQYYWPGKEVLLDLALERSQKMGNPMDLAPFFERGWLRNVFGQVQVVVLRADGSGVPLVKCICRTSCHSLEQ